MNLNYNYKVPFIIKIVKGKKDRLVGHLPEHTLKESFLGRRPVIGFLDNCVKERKTGYFEVTQVKDMRNIDPHKKWAYIKGRYIDLKDPKFESILDFKPVCAEVNRLLERPGFALKNIFMNNLGEIAIKVHSFHTLPAIRSFKIKTLNDKVLLIEIDPDNYIFTKGGYPYDFSEIKDAELIYDFHRINRPAINFGNHVFPFENRKDIIMMSIYEMDQDESISFNMSKFCNLEMIDDDLIKEMHENNYDLYAWMKANLKSDPDQIHQQMQIARLFCKV